MDLTKAFWTPVPTQQFSMKYCLLNGQAVSSEKILLESLQNELELSDWNLALN